LGFPSFSVIEPSKRKICVTVILDTEFWPALEEVEPPALNGLRSKPVLVGEFKPCEDAGEKFPDLISPPPLPLLPPPPPEDAVV